MKKVLLTLMAVATMCAPATAQNRVKNLYASQPNLDCSLVLNTEQTVQLSRYLMAGYNTLCLPMSVSAEQLQTAFEGVRIERLVGMQQEGASLVMYFLDCTEEGVTAGVPYLIFAPKTQYLRLKNTEALQLSDNLQTIRLSDPSGNTVSFGSSWETIRQDGLFGIPAQQNTPILESILIRTTTDKAFLPTRCGFNWERQANGASDLTIRHIKSLDEATGIRTLENGLTVEKEMYDLNGRRIGAAKKGIVIENGRKVVIK